MGACGEDGRGDVSLARCKERGGAKEQNGTVLIMSTEDGGGSLRTVEGRTRRGGRARLREKVKHSHWDCLSRGEVEALKRGKECGRIL